MAKTADVPIGIWSEPWFQSLAPEGKTLYLWAVTCSHGNHAGLYRVAAPIIQVETGLTPARFETALRELDGRLVYRHETGTVWILGHPERTRSKTPQIATSIARAVEDCPEPDVKAEFVARYATNQWLAEALSSIPLESQSVEPQRASANLKEVPTTGSNTGSKKEEGSGEKEKPPPSPDDLPHDLDPAIAAAAHKAVPILQRTAEARKAQPVQLTAVARAVESYPDRDHVRVASEVEHWCVFGSGSKRQCKDVVQRFRNFLDRADPVARAPTAGLDRSAYNRNTEVIAA